MTAKYEPPHDAVYGTLAYVILARSQWATLGDEAGHCMLCDLSLCASGLLEAGSSVLDSMHHPGLHANNSHLEEVEERR